MLVVTVSDPLGDLMNPTRRVASAALDLRGLVHVLGFVVAWKLAIASAMPYSTRGLQAAGEQRT
jgi:hypothetical protein